MTTPNEELAQKICIALQNSGLAAPNEIEKISQKILAGKAKAEDWYSIFENSLPRETESKKDGN